MAEELETKEEQEGGREGGEGEGDNDRDSLRGRDEAPAEDEGGEDSRCPPRQPSPAPERPAQQK